MLRVLRESEQNVELIKQRIDLCKENLKFLNSFYLPVLSGMAIVIATDNSMSVILRYSWSIVGLMALCFLTLLKQDAVDTIDGLIDKL